MARPKLMAEYCEHPTCSRVAVSKSLCDKHYRRLIKRGSIFSVGSRVVDEGGDIERFRAKYVIDESSGCLLWTGGTRLSGGGRFYGRHWLQSGKAEGAHRFSYRTNIGPIPSGMLVCHKCDTPLCVNPYHLFVSDQKGNMRDMIEKGLECRLKGEDRPWVSKLTNKQAEEVRDMNMSQSKIAALYGISQTAVSRIKRGVSYA